MGFGQDGTQLATALMTALANRSFEEWRSHPNMWRRLVEVAVAGHIANQALRHGLQIYYWREGNHEEDFIIRKGERLIAIEGKSGLRYILLSGMALFSRKYNPYRAITVGPTGVKMEEFLETPLSEWLK